MVLPQWKSLNVQAVLTFMPFLKEWVVPVTLIQLLLTFPGDYATIQAAISDYCLTGGTQTGAYKPFVIAIDPASGPFDESLSLDQTSAGNGDIAGDIVIAATGATKAVVKLQKGIGLVDDGYQCCSGCC